MGYVLLFFRILGSERGGKIVPSPILRSRLLVLVACIHSFGNDKTLNVRKLALTSSVVPLRYPLMKGQPHSPFMNNENSINIPNQDSYSTLQKR